MKKLTKTTLNRSHSYPSITAMEYSNYISSFGIVHNDFIDVHSIVPLAYASYLNMFRDPVDEKTQRALNQFSDLMFRFIEDLRTKETTFIAGVMNHINSAYHNEPLIDLMIIMWCLPRHNLSKEMYINEYKNNIREYQQKMIDLIREPFMADFTKEVTNKRCFLSIHCIDYIWRDLSENKVVEFRYINSYYGMFYFGIDVGIENADDVVVSIFMPAIFMLDIGNGQNNVSSQKRKLSLKQFIIDIITNDNLNVMISESQTTNHFSSQCDLIKTNFLSQN